MKALTPRARVELYDGKLDADDVTIPYPRGKQGGVGGVLVYRADKPWRRQAAPPLPPPPLPAPTDERLANLEDQVAELTATVERLAVLTEALTGLPNSGVVDLGQVSAGSQD
jgi:hypothetical protein